MHLPSGLAKSHPAPPQSRPTPGAAGTPRAPRRTRRAPTANPAGSTRPGTAALCLRTVVNS